MQFVEQTLDSREVAEMIGKDHKNILRDIRGYNKELGELKIEPSDFFTESTYQSSQNKVQPCYLVTKKGCEFIAHKLTGIKGTEFTARYINRFHEMEQQLQMENHIDWFVNDIRVFQHREFGILRTLNLDGQFYFIGIDATRALGYVNNTDTLKKRVSNDEKCYVNICDGTMSRKMIAITKKGLDELISTGKLPMASKYNDWIHKVVIPTLNGGGIVPVNVKTEPVKEQLPEKKKEELLIPTVKNPIRVFRELMELAEERGMKVQSLPLKGYKSMLRNDRIAIRDDLSMNEIIFELAYELSHAILHKDCGNMVESENWKEYHLRAIASAFMLIETLNIKVAWGKA